MTLNKKMNNKCLFDAEKQCPLFSEPFRTDDIEGFCIACQLNEIKKVLNKIFSHGIPVYTEK